MIMNENEIINKLVPVFLEDIADENTKKLFSKYADLEGENANYGDLLDMGQILIDLLKQVKNYEEISIKYVKMLNTVVPKRWHDRFRKNVQLWISDNVEFEIDDNKNVKQLLIFLDEIFKKNINTAGALVDVSKEIANSFFDTDRKHEEWLEESASYTEEMVNHTMMKIPVKLENVKLYHGTSYENYLEIKKDGYIKTTDYSKGDFQNDNLQEIYNGESGYVFTSDSMDFPFSFGFGGHRENMVGWAYNHSDSEKKKSKYRDIGVIFEIDPKNYDVLYYGNKGESEFLIKGTVDLKDTSVRLFKWKDNGFMEISEEDLKEEAA